MATMLATTSLLACVLIILLHDRNDILIAFEVFPPVVNSTLVTENVTGIPLDLKDLNCGDSGAMTVFLQQGTGGHSTGYDFVDEKQVPQGHGFREAKSGKLTHR
jgi:hypothetical protein